MKYKSYVATQVFQAIVFWKVVWFQQTVVLYGNQRESSAPKQHFSIAKLDRIEPKKAIAACSKKPVNNRKHFCSFRRARKKQFHSNFQMCPVSDRAAWNGHTSQSLSQCYARQKKRHYGTTFALTKARRGQKRRTYTETPFRIRCVRARHELGILRKRLRRFGSVKSQTTTAFQVLPCRCTDNNYCNCMRVESKRAPVTFRMTLVNTGVRVWHWAMLIKSEWPRRAPPLLCVCWWAIYMREKCHRTCNLACVLHKKSSADDLSLSLC